MPDNKMSWDGPLKFLLGAYGRTTSKPGGGVAPEGGTHLTWAWPQRVARGEPGG